MVGGWYGCGAEILSREGPGADAFEGMRDMSTAVVRSCARKGIAAVEVYAVGMITACDLPGLPPSLEGSLAR